jgi:hypothetical protein
VSIRQILFLRNLLTKIYEIYCNLRNLLTKLNLEAILRLLK